MQPVFIEWLEDDGYYRLRIL